MGAESPTVYPGRRDKSSVLIPLCACARLWLWYPPMALVRIAISRSRRALGTTGRDVDSGTTPFTTLLLRARASGAESSTVYPGRRDQSSVLIPLCACVLLGLWCFPLVLMLVAISPGPWHDRPRRGLWYYAFYYAFTMRSCSRPRSRLRSAARTHPKD